MHLSARAVRAVAAPRRRNAVAVQASAEAPEQLSRRAALGLVAVAPGLLASGAATAASPTTDWKAVKADILAVIADSSSVTGISERGPTLVRLAWHSSGTYDKMQKNGGSGKGTIRFREELAHGANAGLDKPVAWLEPLKQSHPALSYADLYTYAGAVAIEAMGGPSIPFRAGRVDSLDPADVTPDGRLPEADLGGPPRTAAGLRSVFGRMGFDDQAIVALSGAHALGRCHVENSGYVGPWQPVPTAFSNIYFKLLLKAGKDGAAFWTVDPQAPKFQYVDPSGSLMMLPSDIVLVQDDGFKPFVQQYAKDKKLFYADFARYFQQLEELGTKNLKSITA